MTKKIKIGIQVLENDKIPDNEPIIIEAGAKFVIEMEIHKEYKNSDFDILCLPSSSGIIIYGIQDNIARMNRTLSEIEIT